MDHAISLSNVNAKLQSAFETRYKVGQGPPTVRMVGLLFARAQARLAQQILPSLTDFDARSGNNIDFFFPGYIPRVVPAYDHYPQYQPQPFGWTYEADDFHSFVREVESETRWRYSGGCDLILMGGYGHGPAVELVLGSAVDQVLRESRWPALICR